MRSADDWARLVTSGAPIASPVAVVIAHPDDETLWAGAALNRLQDATLVLVTDGAPEDMGDATRLGYATRAAYAEARRHELAAALDALGEPRRLLRYEIPDQQAAFQVGDLAARLVEDCADAAVFLTHPYEGGHPDHDATALAVHLAASQLAVPVVEFACYARIDGTRVFARFVPGAHPEHARALSDDDRTRIEYALAAHASQTSVFGSWRPTVERWRAAPQYDFTRPPPGEAVLYDEFGWSMTGERWRAATHGLAASLACR